MSNLESIVPPLELCKLIPDGEFEDSVVVYRFDHQQAGKMFPETNEDERFFYVEEREMVEFAQRNMVNPPPTFPAPTLEEIITSLLTYGWLVKIDCRIQLDTLIEFYSEKQSKTEFGNTASETALRLWFKVKGIESK